MPVFVHYNTHFKTKIMTAVEWLIEQIKNDQNQKALSAKEWIKVIEQAKQMEKEQIEDAHIEGQRVFDKHPHTQWTNDQAEHYYAETYGSKVSDTPQATPQVTPQVTSSQTEISDEEIEKYASDFYDNNGSESIFILGAKWYREQLKKKQ